MAAPPKPPPLILLTTLLFLKSTVSTAAPIPDDLLAAMAEMQKANYFTFVMLLKMSAPELNSTDLRNVTFFMPNDKTLSQTAIPPESLLEFVLRHSIPSPLLFNNLHLIPSGSLIPSSQPGYLLRVANGGRRSFFLNNARILSPNICSSRWSSIRCHGIDDVLAPDETAFSSPSCSNVPPMPTAASPPLLVPPPFVVTGGQVPAPSPTPNSGPSKRRSCGSLEFSLLLTLLLISILNFFCSL